MFGQILINFLFASSLVCSAAYFFSIKGNDDLRKAGRILLYIIAGGMIVASSWLLYNILIHNFQYTYIWGYSSKDLPTPLLISTFYAGQEGSFMLWTLWLCLIGIALLPYVKKVKYESEVMGFYALILAFLFLKLVTKSPFAFVWETHAADVAAGFTPENGRGLNPLLHNYWITIHPPILFAGFAMMSVPFVFAMAALLKRDYQRWISVALPWTLFSTAVLGFGIMLGGFWAYETLGWGGFWAWDPVENSSLIPWLVGVALVHTMLTQKKTKGLVKTNLALSVIAFLLVLYSTFLTRSGVLGDTSVHSFVDPGYFAFVLLIIFIIVFSIIGFGMILYRAKDIASQKADFNLTSREFALSIGAAFVMASAVIVTIGTSWPLISEILGQPKIAIDPAFYNKMHLPLAILIMILNGISLNLSWKATSEAFWRKLQIPFGLTLIVGIALVVAGVRDVWFAVLTFGSLFALFVNIDLGRKIALKSPKLLGTYISHFGLSMLFLGIVATSRYSVLDHAQLPQGVPIEKLGYKFTYLHKEQIEKEFKDREKYQYLVKVEKDGFETVVKPILYLHDFNKRMSYFLEPGIGMSAFRDIYVSPKAVETTGGIPTLVFGKNEPTMLPVDSTYKITLLKFDMSSVMQNQGSPNMKIGAVVQIDHNGVTMIDTMFTTFMNGMEGEVIAQPLKIQNTTYQTRFLKLIPNKQSLSKSQGEFSFKDTAKPEPPIQEVFTVEVSVKPFINFVWFGVIFMVSGFFVSIARRYKELKSEN